MTGPEHFAEAERCLGSAEDADPDARPELVALMLQFASVHATLALAAANRNEDVTGLCMHGNLLCAICIGAQIAERMAQS